MVDTTNRTSGMRGGEVDKHEQGQTDGSPARAGGSTPRVGRGFKFSARLAMAATALMYGSGGESADKPTRASHASGILDESA